MTNKVLLKKSSVASKVPLTTDLDYGELALNYADGKIYFKNSSNVIKSFTIDDSVVTLTGTQTLTNKTLTSPTINSATLSGTLSGTVALSGIVTFSGGDGNNSSAKFAGYNQRGGVGYHGFFEVTNTYGSATTPNKYFRLNSAGQLEIVNSAYTTTILSLSDAGVLSVPQISAGGSVGTTGQVLSSTGTGLQWVTVGGTGTVTSVVAGTGLTGGTITTSGTIALATSGVTAGSYGSATAIPAITVDTYGRITAISTNNVSTTISLTGTSGTGSVSGGGTLTFANGGGVTSTVSGSTITHAIDSTVATLTGTQTLTNKTLTFPVVDNFKLGLTSTATAAGTTTLTATSNKQQRFTGTTTQTVVLPVTSTLAVGVSYEIENASTGAVTVNSSGGNLVATVPAGVTMNITCIGTTLTTAADWDAEYYAWGAATGSGSVVMATSPTLTTPTLGVASATSINKVAITAPATSATLTIADGKTLTASNTLTFTGTDASSVAFGTGGTVVYTANKLSVHAATTSAELAGVISDETGTGALVFANTPTLVTPNIGAATGTSLSVSGSLTSTVATGTAPLVVTSTTLVSNLNVDYLDGQHGSYYTTAGNLSGTIPSAVLGNSTVYIGTTAVALNRASANLALTGILSETYVGSTSGTIQVIPAAVAGTGTVITLPATTGTVVTTGDSGTVTNTMLAGSIANAKLANSTISGVALGSNLNALTIGTGLTGTSYNGSSAVTIALGTTAVTAGSYTFANITVDAYGRITAASSAATSSSSVQFGSLGIGTSASGTTGEIRATATITAYYSDARLKDFSGKIDNALSKVMALNGYYFTENQKAKELGYNNDARQVGVSAQEVEAVLPEVIADAPINSNFEGADYKTVHYEKLVPLLIEAIKEQQAQIEELKAKLGN